MKKEKLTIGALNALIEECSMDKSTTLNIDLIERTGSDGKTPGKRKIDFRKLEKNKERFRYLLAQTYPYHENNDLGYTIAQEFSILSDDTQWTKDPIDLQRFLTLATALDLISPLVKREFPYTQGGKTTMKTVLATDLDWKGRENRIKPVIHEDKTPDEK